MKLLLDQGLPRSTLRHLAALGIAAEHVGDLGMAAASDFAILDHAKQKNEVVVTLDADFHSLLAATQATSPSVIRIRIQALNGEQTAAVLVQVVSVLAASSSNAVISVTESRIRVRSLPIGR